MIPAACFYTCYRSQNSWEGACLPWCSISSPFENSLKTSGHRGYEFLEFWFWNSVPFLPDIGFKLLKSRLWHMIRLMMHQMFSIGERSVLQVNSAPDSSTTKPCCCNSCSVWFCIVLLKYMSSGGVHMLLYNFYIPFSIQSAFQNMQAPHTICTYAAPYHQRCWLLNWTLITCWKVSLLFSLEDTCTWFTLNLDSSDHKHFSTLKQSILNEPWPTGHDGTSGPCSHMAFFLHDKALVGICRWHDRLCLPTVVSGSIPGPI